MPPGVAGELLKLLRRSVAAPAAFGAGHSLRHPARDRPGTTAQAAASHYPGPGQVRGWGSARGPAIDTSLDRAPSQSRVTGPECGRTESGYERLSAAPALKSLSLSLVGPGDPARPVDLEARALRRRHSTAGAEAAPGGQDGLCSGLWCRAHTGTRTIQFRWVGKCYHPSIMTRMSWNWIPGLAGSPPSPYLKYHIHFELLDILYYSVGVWKLK